MPNGQTRCFSCGEPLSDAALKNPRQLPVLVCMACRRTANAQHRDGWRPVMDWEDGRDGLRLASLAPVPWRSTLVTMLQLSRNGAIRTAYTITGKRDMLRNARREDMLLVSWSGERRQGTFIVDDRDAAMAALNGRT